MQSLNKSKKITKPYKGKILYEIRNYCRFELFKLKTKFFLKI